MSVNIKVPDETFNFSELSLGNPTSISNGFYYSPISHGGELYIQTPEVVSKAGFVKSGNKQHIDLILKNSDEHILEWFENLENRVKMLIYNNRLDWFNETIELSDIENIFISPIRSHKSGKQFVIRCHVEPAKTSLGVDSIKIYDLNQNELPMKEINVNSRFITLLKVSGIKFSSRTFQIYIEIKQLMVMTGENIFNSCLIKSPQGTTDVLNENIKETLDQSQLETENREIIEETKEETKEEKKKETKEEKKKETKESSKVQENEDPIEDTKNLDSNQSIDETHPTQEQNEDCLVIETNINQESKSTENEMIKETYQESEQKDNQVDLSLEQKTNEIDEFEVNVNTLEDVNIKLQQPEEEHIELYKTTLQKAKELRKQALQSHLEAQNIKAKYLLNVYSESDSDYSESEEYLE